jgi:hypothetical protein
MKCADGRRIPVAQWRVYRLQSTCAGKLTRNSLALILGVPFHWVTELPYKVILAWDPDSKCFWEFSWTLGTLELKNMNQFLLTEDFVHSY